MKTRNSINRKRENKQLTAADVSYDATCIDYDFPERIICDVCKKLQACGSLKTRTQKGAFRQLNKSNKCVQRWTNECRSRKNVPRCQIDTHEETCAHLNIVPMERSTCVANA